jgi:ATP-dependent DNA helicase RecG
MANSHGGRVVLGVKERKDHSFRVIGLGEPERVERELWDGLQNPTTVSVNILGRDDVALEDVGGKTVLVINIPRANREDRPVYIRGDLWGGTYLRVHEGDRKAGKERVRRMVADAEYEARDDRVLGDFGIDDLDSESLQTYRQIFQDTDPDHPWVGLDHQTFLQQLGAWRRDRTSGEEGLTAAGLLLLGRYEAIREVFQHYFVDYQERAAEADSIEWLDRIYPDGKWSGNLFEFYRRVVRKLVADLRVPFQLGEDLTRRDSTHVHEALREALVNTLIHADYEGRLSVEVIKRPDRFEFRNPGTLRLPVEQIRAGGHSDCRNRTLQGMLLRIGLGERAGSGFSRIQRAWREQHWAAPSLVEDAGLDEVRLRLGMVSLLGEDVVEALDRRFRGGAFRELDEAARLALGTAMSEGQVTNRRMQEISDRHPRDLTFMLRNLVDSGFLEPHGERGGTWYTVTEASSVHKEGSSVHKDESSVHKDGSSVHSETVKRVAESLRRPTQEVREAILELCTLKERTITELSRLLSRRSHTLRKGYLRPMVEEGLLELKYPERPSHPRQAYRSGRSEEGSS